MVSFNYSVWMIKEINTNTGGVNSLKAGDDIKTVQENLGHHTAAFTLDVYAHVTSGMKRDSAGRMEKYLQSVTRCFPSVPIVPFTRDS